jgi:transcriptional regulator with XRE-family HTH domain
MNAKNLRAKRAAARITGRAICQLVNFSKSKLSDIENGNVTATTEELSQIHAAIESIIRTRQQLAKLASESGLSLAGVRI